MFDPGDPADLGRVISDLEAAPDQFEKYGAQARLTYEQRFDPERSMAHLLEIYRYAMEHSVS
jgi:glycosyltransferase involved in cell wall biosynthesis